MLLLMSIEEHLLELAGKIKKARITSEMTQKAAIPLSTYRRFEQKGEGSVRDLVKICIALGRIRELENFLAAPPYSPVAAYEKQTKERKRVRHVTQS